MNRVVVVALCLAACGGSQSSPRSAEPRDISQDASVPLQVRNFNERLAPLWNAPAADQRASDTCRSLSILKSNTAGLRSVHPDRVLDAATYEASVAALEADLVALDEPCTTLNRAQFEQRFEKLHSDFQALTAQIRRN